MEPPVIGRKRCQLADRWRMLEPPPRRESSLSSSSRITENPSETRHSNPAESLDLAISRAYQELRAIAHRRLAGRDPGATLSTTALVNETYLKLIDSSSAEGVDP